jgi:hypothetical protein
LLKRRESPVLFLDDGRMENRIEEIPLVARGKNEGSELLPIDAAVLAKDLRSERFDDAAPCGLPGLDELPGDPVRIDEGAAAQDKDLRDRRFSGREAAGKPGS